MASEEARRAEKLYREGLTPAEIAKKLNKPLSTVTSWKRRHQWGDPEGATQRECNVAEKVQCNATPTLDERLIAAVEENEELDEWEETFCLHYSRTFNATASYRRAKPECTYNTANTEGPALLVKPCIRDEVKRLKEMRQLDMLATVDDVVERMMQIAFSDLTDFVEWGRYEEQVMGMYGPVYETDEETGEQTPVTKIINDIRFIDSDQVDGTLVSKVKKGRDGISVERPDQMKALLWLADYFEANPSDKHRREFDRRRLELETLKIAVSQGGSADQAPADDGFLAALNSDAKEMWGSNLPDDSQEGWVSDDGMETS